jgi:uncharacterized protein YhbP (UPF0306 family)
MKSVPFEKIIHENGGNFMTVASQIKQTLAGLKGVQGTLRIYSSQARNEEARSVYNEALAVTEKIINDLEQRVQTLEFEEPQYKGN